MEENEIYIFIVYEGKKYILEVPKSIKYISLKEKIKKDIIHVSHFFAVYNSEKFDRNKNNQILNLNQGDIISISREIYMCHCGCIRRRNFEETDKK